MLRNTDVPTMMMRVEATLDAAAKSPNGARGVMKVASEGDRHLNLGQARQLAGIETDFPATSDRAFVGRLIGFGKRALRRSMRWYVTPMIRQQTRFNHAAVDLFESVRLSVDRLARRLDALQPASLADVDAVLADCRNVVDVEDTDSLHSAGPGSVDGVRADARILAAPEVAAVVEAAFAALAPGGKLAILTTDAAPVPPAAIAWALGTAGFTAVRQQPVDVVPSPTPPAKANGTASTLAEELDRVSRLYAGPRTVAVLAVRPRTAP